MCYNVVEINRGLKMKYYTSDLHLNHANLITFNIPTRKFKNIQEHNAFVTTRWNTIVNWDDEVYCLGDFALGPPEDIPSYVNQLNGIKHLITGNHDWGKEEYHEQAAWESIQKQLHIIDGEYKVWLAHMPLQKAPDKRGYERPIPLEDYDICLGGHVHGKYFVNDCSSINVGVDVNDFYPKTLEQLLEKASTSEMEDSSKFYPV